MTLAQALTYLAALVGTVGGLGALAQFTRRSADVGTIASLNESVAALKIADDVKTAQIEELTKRLTSAEAENKFLRGTVTQAKEVANLTSMLSEHHTESMGELKAIRTEMKK